MALSSRIAAADRFSLEMVAVRSCFRSATSLQQQETRPTMRYLVKASWITSEKVPGLLFERLLQLRKLALVLGSGGGRGLLGLLQLLLQLGCQRWESEQARADTKCG